MLDVNNATVKQCMDFIACYKGWNPPGYEYESESSYTKMFTSDLWSTKTPNGIEICDGHPLVEGSIGQAIALMRELVSGWQWNLWTDNDPGYKVSGILPDADKPEIQFYDLESPAAAMWRLLVGCILAEEKKISN